MAPGCFSNQSTNGKESMNEQASAQMPPVKPITRVAITSPPTSPRNKRASSELFKPLHHLLSPAESRSRVMSIGSISNTKSPNNYSAASAATHYEIPLPLTPPPERFNAAHANKDKEAELDDESSVDSFEILEQTILKQKRISKLKNTDLRKKVLLKRTFDLICDIMDADNGLTTEADETSNEESELELELHDHSQMDEDSLIYESASEAKQPELAKPVEEDSQVLPRQASKRLCDQDEDDDETFFCESDSSDQQLNYCRSRASEAVGELKIYNDDSSAAVKTVSPPQQHRNNHQRSKRVRIN